MNHINPEIHAAMHALMCFAYNTSAAKIVEYLFPDTAEHYKAEKMGLISDRSFASFWGQLDHRNRAKLAAWAWEKYGDEALDRVLAEMAL